jgi:tetratricopeptide (TPR) repeat protein
MSELSRQRKKNDSPPRQVRASDISRGRRWLFRVVLLTLPILLLALMEVALRLADYGYDPHLFKRLKIGGEEFFVQKEDFSRRFFPKEIARNPGPVRFRVHKAPGTFRIFVFGESAAMGDPVQSFAPDRYLEMLLRQKYPDRQFELINVAFTAINSHVIVPIARECAAHEGDLWIIYMGNNEMVGPFGAATVFGWQAPPLSVVRLVTAVQRLRTGQWLMDMGRNLRGSATNSAAAWGGMAMFLNNQIAPDSPRKERVYRNFETNLHDITRAGLDSGAKVLLNTVGVNLKDCPPFASMSNSNLSASDRAQFDALYSKAMQVAGVANGAASFEQAARLQPKLAELQFNWGECLLRQTNFGAAQAHFQLACDYDALPFRADSRINSSIVGEAKRVGDKGLILFDAAAALAGGSDTGICGQETFYEHVHFGLNARYRLGRAWAEQVARLLPAGTNTWISRAACDEMLGLSPWNRAQVLHFMLERLQTPPLSTQPNNDARRNLLESLSTQLRPQMNAENAATTRKLFSKMLEERPEDYFLEQEFAVFLELSGDAAGAEAAWRRYCELLPQDSLGHFQSGRLLIALQKYAEAETALRKSLAIRATRTDAWIELGSALALQKKYPEALAIYDTALKKEPQNGQTLLRRGKVLGYLNRHAEAMESYRAALQLNPADGLAHYELGLELLGAHDMAGAGKEFGEAARFTPDRVAARFNYGTWLMNERHWEEARREFEAVLRLEPGNVQAQRKLATLQAVPK